MIVNNILADKNKYDIAESASVIAEDKPVFDFFKRIADIVLSLAASVVILPLCIIIAAVIRLSDGGNVLYAHSRMGRNGKMIKVYKFRSMKPGADKLSDFLTPEQIELYKKEYKLRDDPRVSRIGAFLRKTSLDELPQIFINVLILGNMSLVGPRPVLEEETLLYGENRSAFLSVKPGLTGYWAAYADDRTSYSDGSRQEMELYYVANRCVALDLKIILKTVFTVFRKAGA